MNAWDAAARAVVTIALFDLAIFDGWFFFYISGKCMDWTDRAIERVLGPVEMWHVIVVGLTAQAGILIWKLA